MTTRSGSPSPLRSAAVRPCGKVPANSGLGAASVKLAVPVLIRIGQLEAVLDGDGEIEVAVAVEVGGGERPSGCCRPARGCGRGSRRSCRAVVAQDRDRVTGAPLGDREVRVGIAVEIAGGDRERAGRRPAAGLEAGSAKLPEPLLRRIVTSSETWFETARSGSPSPSTSAAAIALGKLPSVLGARPGARRSCPCRCSAGRSRGPRELPVARSRSPSPSKSASTILRAEADRLRAGCELREVGRGRDRDADQSHEEPAPTRRPKTHAVSLRRLRSPVSRLVPSLLLESRSNPNRCRG